jgi:hypothetical protein
VEYDYAGQTSGYPPSALVPKEQAWEAARRFLETGQRPDNLEWEQV